MERDPSGTDYGQYWQPEAQPGYGQTPAIPEQQRYPDQQQYGEQPQQYQDPSYQQPYAAPGYPSAGYPDASYAEQQYPAAPYADPAYPYPQQPGQPSYPQPPYGDEQYPYQPAGYPAQDYPQQQEYAPSYDPAADATAQWSSAELYQPDGYPAEPYRPDGYRPDPYPAADPSPAESATPGTPAPPGTSGTPDAAPAAGRDQSLPADEPKPAGSSAATARAEGPDRRTLMIRGGIGAFAVLVVAVVGYAVAGNGSSTPPPAAAGQANLSGSHVKAWSAAAVTAATGNDGLVGSWLLANAVVRGDGAGVTAYDTAKGSKLWTVAPPTPGAVPCAMSATVNSGGVGAVLFQAKAGTGQPCTQLVAVDTATGAAKWKATINKAGSAYGASVMVNDTRAVAVGDTAAVGYDIATGKTSWTYTGPGKYCGALTGSGTGGTLLIQSTCADTNPKQQAINLDAGTGKLVWWRGLPQTAASYTVLSAVPPVVGVHMADPTKDSIMSFSSKGDSQATINISQTAGLLDSMHGSFDPDPALFFQDNTMLAEITPGGAGSGTAGLIGAFNLVDGKQLWQATPTEKGRSALVGIDSGAAVVASEERIGQPARLSHYDLATGKENPGGQFPQGTGSLLTSGRVLYRTDLVTVLPEFTIPYGTSATLFSTTG